MAGSGRRERYDRALLIGVSQYASDRPLEVAEGLGDIAAVERNLTELRAALDAGGDGCRRSGVTVHSAGSAETVEAFRTQYGEWAHAGRSGFNPVGTVGPQPDVWIPAPSASARRARDESGTQPSVLSLDSDDAEPLAHAPSVLLVPDRLAEAEGGRTGRTLAELLTAMRAKDEKAQVRRADPRYTDAGLAAARGLYRVDAPRAVELGQRRQGRSLPTGKDLVCGLARGSSAEDRAVGTTPAWTRGSGTGPSSGSGTGWRRTTAGRSSGTRRSAARRGSPRPRRRPARRPPPDRCRAP
ncbi:substrate-binding domain-containing protein [Streptomyces sp. UNOB3_S3]|uniref:substrate-binding domain-containing protein n=1 Tax=Streptomyces sp. UNOB3_S3 TaxID=2871682 RepID=UPI001E5F9821|nr:substrate-binding domain-containing protein [Streptomyces sp. UNOB3_S3]MCC3778695.1 substrate-binding domain-containing protein [Streptomyces sp. UNOB3_S3]